MKYRFLLLLLLPLAIHAQTVDELVQQAGDLFEKGRLADAATLLENGVTRNPGSARLHGVLARIYLEQGNMNKAYTVASKGLTIDANDVNLGLTFSRAALALGKSEEALRRTTADISRDPSFFGLYLVQGDALSDLGRYNEAITAYGKAIGLRADYGPAYRRRAAAQRQLHNYSSAITDYNEALRLTPNDFESLNGRGMTYYFNGNSQAAINDYTAALAVRPDAAATLNNRGVAYAALHNEARAIADYQASIAADPQFADPHFQLAALRIDAGDLSGASTEINSALRLDDANALFEVLHSKILLRQGKTDEGLKAATRALSLDRTNTDALFYQAIALNNSERYSEAGAALQRAMQLAPSDYLFQGLSAYMNRQAGHIAEADAADAKAAQLARAAGTTYTPLLARDQGCISGNCVTGTGTYVFPSGNRYNGGFSNRRLEGSGTFTFANGEHFEGSFSSNQKTQGTYTFNNGAVYTGTYNAEGREWNGHYQYNQVSIPVVNGVAQVPKDPLPIQARTATASSSAPANNSGHYDVMCMQCFGSGKIHKTVYGGQYEYDKYGNRSVSFGSYETCTACFGKGTVHH